MPYPVHADWVIQTRLEQHRHDERLTQVIATLERSLLEETE